MSNPELVRADADPLMGLGGPVTGWQARALRGSAGLVRGRIGVTLALGWLVVIICLALLAPVLPLPTYFDFVGAPKVALGLHALYLLGTDYLGRSVLVRLIWGTRISLTVGLLAVFLGMIIGLAIGMTAGYFRGRVEAVLTVFIDAALAFPPLILLLAITAVLQQKLSTLIIAFTLLTIPSFARLARANTLAIAQREFVLAARARGTGSFRIIRREILPNVILPTISYSFIIVASVMVAEGSLDSPRDQSRHKIIDHPDVGLIALDCDALIVAGDDLRITVYTAEPGTQDAERLALAIVLGTQALVD